MGDFLAKKGERVLLVGQTGSGKTQNAIFQLRHAPVYPAVVFDTKIEDAFFGLPEERESIDLIESVEAFEKLSKLSPRHWPDYILVRPAINELQDMAALNAYCGLVYNRYGSLTAYYDELYNWHDNGRALPNFVGLLTRGRSRGKTVIQSTQRPSWVSRFCFTESQKFFLHYLSDIRDRKTLDSMVPGYSAMEHPPQFHFYRYEVGSRNPAQLCMPVPFQQLDTTKIFNRHWL